MKTTWGDTLKPECEKREYEAVVVSRQNGRTQRRITCPFCLERFTAYIWSLAGCGKRCSCGAIFGMIAGFKLKDTNNG